MARGEKLHDSVKFYAAMASNFRSGNAEKFNSALADYQALLGKDFVKEAKKGRMEAFFNQMEPFYKSNIFYVTALLLGLLFWIVPSEWARRSASWLIMLGLVIHTVGLIFRMVLEGRPPVTNLYSSAIFIGWGAMVLGLVLERFFKVGLGSAVAALAGFLAIIYILRGFFTSGLDQPTAKSLVKMVYGIVCFATLFSFVGTVLGGIWADQSWGRFWGWDPKENGALIIVLWNALMLHARWGGMVRERGFINMAIVGNIVTSWSWFGVNMLGIGLHSYGFMDAAFYWLMTFVIANLVLIGIGAMPVRLWRSFRSVEMAAA